MSHNLDMLLIELNDDDMGCEEIMSENISDTQPDEWYDKEYSGWEIKELYISPMFTGGWISLEKECCGLMDNFIIRTDNKIAFDNWFPEEEYNRLSEIIMLNLDKEKQIKLVRKCVAEKVDAGWSRNTGSGFTVEDIKSVQWLSKEKIKIKFQDEYTGDCFVDLTLDPIGEDSINLRETENLLLFLEENESFPCNWQVCYTQYKNLAKEKTVISFTEIEADSISKAKSEAMRIFEKLEDVYSEDIFVKPIVD